MVKLHLASVKLLFPLVILLFCETNLFVVGKIETISVYPNNTRITPKADIVNFGTGKISNYFNVSSKCGIINGTNEELSRCITILRDQIRPLMGVGVPEIGFRPLEPIHLKTFDFSEGSNGPIVIHTKFNDLNMWGLTSYTKWIITIDKAAKTWSYDMIVPRMRLEGNYAMTGKIFIFELGGNGTFYFNLKDFSLSGTNPLHVRTNEEGQKYLVATRSPIRMDIKHIQIHLNNLFNGNQILGPVINNFLNENVQEIFQEIKPGLEHQVANIGAYVINGLLGGLSELAKYFDDETITSTTTTTTTTTTPATTTTSAITTTTTAATTTTIQSIIANSTNITNDTIVIRS